MINDIWSGLGKKYALQDHLSICCFSMLSMPFSCLISSSHSRLVTHNKTYLCVVVNMSVSGPSDKGLIDLSLYEHTTPRCGDAMMRHKMKIICLLLEKCARQPVRELSKGRYKTTHIKNQPSRQPRKRVWGKIINFLKGFLTDGVTG